MRLIHLRFKKCLMALIIIGAITTVSYSNIKKASPNNIHNQPVALLTKEATVKHQNKLLKKAIDKIGESDSGDAEVVYHKKTHKLVFVLLDMDYENEFEHSLMTKQTKRFKRISHVSTVYPVLIISHHARVRKTIQLHEEAQQRKLNAKRAHQQKVKHDKKQRDNKIKKMIQQSRHHSKNKKNNKNKKKVNHRNQHGKRNQKKSSHHKK